MFISSTFLAESHQFKISVFCWHLHANDLFNKCIGLKSILNKLLDRDKFQIAYLCDLSQFRQSRHRAILVHDLNEYTGWLEACKTGKINCGLGVTSPSQHSTLFCAQRKNVSRPAKVFRLCTRINKCLYRFGAVVGRNAGSTSM